MPKSRNVMCALRKNLILAVKAILSPEVKAAGPRVDRTLAKLSRRYVWILIAAVHQTAKCND